MGHPRAEKNLPKLPSGVGDSQNVECRPVLLVMPEPGYLFCHANRNVENAVDFGVFTHARELFGANADE